MSPDEYFQFHKKVCDEARELSKRKNNDYADPDSFKNDRFRVFKNFVLCNQLGVCSTEQGFLVRLADKFSRICNLLRAGHKQTVKDESIEDTAKDVINYLILLLAYRKESQE
jgi:hypothetical protein